MNINIQVIDDKDHRYPFTGADWWYEPDGTLQVRVSKLSDWKREFVLALHETIEAVTCKNDGVVGEAVDKFDIEFDKTHTSDVNAGDDILAPYMQPHSLATGIERTMCYVLKVPWTPYDNELGAFPSRQEKRIEG